MGFARRRPRREGRIRPIRCRQVGWQRFAANNRRRPRTKHHSRTIGRKEAHAVLCGSRPSCRSSSRIALAIALLIKAFLVQAFYIEQESMVPTLHPGERVLVSKLNYRFGEPGARRRGDLPRPARSVRSTERSAGMQPGPRPEFRSTGSAGTFGLPTGTSEDLVKRIVGFPGETVAMHGGEVYICHDPGCQPLDPEGRPKDGHVVEFAHTERKGPAGRHRRIDALTMPDDQYYVMGDNRDGRRTAASSEPCPERSSWARCSSCIWPPTRWQGL